MPRSSVILAPVPISGDVVAAAAGAVWAAQHDPSAPPLELRALDEGAALQVVLGDTVLVTVLRPRALPRLDEVERLLPGTAAPAGTAWWTDAVTPWTAEGAVGGAILEAVAQATGGVVVHQGLPHVRLGETPAEL